MVKNVILIQLDSLNRHFLTAYGNTWVQAPNLAAFAEKSHLFLQHHTGSLPCMPARREIWAGAEEFWWRGWGPLEPWDEPLPYLLGQQGVVTQLTTTTFLSGVRTVTTTISKGTPSSGATSTTISRPGLFMMFLNGRSAWSRNTVKGG